jgi:peroxiredoxin
MLKGVAMKKQILILTALAACAAQAGPLSGRRVPSFALPDVAMKYHDVLDYRGRVLIIEIMQTTCPHCRDLAGTLERVKARYGGKVAILSIVVPPDTQQTVSTFIAQHRLSYPVLFDCGQATASLLMVTPRKPGINLPQVLIVDAEGMIREDFEWQEKGVNVLAGDGLFAVLDRILAAPAAPAPAAKKAPKK